MFRPVSLLLCFSMFALSGSSLWAESKRVNWKMATGAEQYERLLWQSIQQKDWQAVESHLASTFVNSTAEGVMNKEQTMAHIHELDITNYSIGDLQVTPAGNDVIVTYTLMLQGIGNGHALPATPWRIMSVWQQQKKGWALQAQSQAEAAPAH